MQEEKKQGQTPFHTKYEIGFDMSEILEKIDQVGAQVKDYRDRYNNRIDAVENNIKDIYEDLADHRALIKHGESVVRKPTLKQSAENVGLFALATVGKNAKAKDLYERRFKNSLSEGTTATGGAMVPEELVGSLINLLEVYGVARRNARVVTMGSDQQKWPKIDSELTVYAPGEAGTITASDPSLSNVNLVAKKLATLTKVSSELAEDSLLDVGKIVGESIARAVAKAEDQCFFLGDGTSTYYGYTGLAGAFGDITPAGAGSAAGGLVTASGNAWSEITIGDIRQLVSVMPNEFDMGAKFYCSRMFYFQILVPLLETSGGAFGASKSEMERANSLTFYGYPVELVSVMPTTEANSQLCLYFGDLSMGAYMGMRRNLEIAQSKDAYFDTDEIGIRGTERVAINIFGHGDSSTASAICALITHSS